MDKMAYDELFKAKKEQIVERFRMHSPEMQEEIVVSLLLRISNERQRYEEFKSRVMDIASRIGVAAMPGWIRAQLEEVCRN